MSKILITGAAGFIGSQLAYRLWKEGNQVVLVDNFSYGKEDNLVFEDKKFNEEIHRKDIRDTKFMETLFKNENFDIVYHIAAITPLPDCQIDPNEAVDVNVRGTVIMLDLVRRYNVKKMIFASTSAVYENNTDFPSKEENVKAPSLLYPSTKYASEQFCKAFYDAYNIPIVCLRFANVYGPHIDCLRTQPPVMAYIAREFYYDRQPEMHSDGKQERDFVYVDDLIDLCVLVSKATKFDIVNVSTNETHNINYIIETIAKYMNKQNIGVKFFDTAHYWHRYPKLYDEPYPINEELLNHEVLKYTCLDNTHAKEEYGWTPKTNIEDGIKKTVEFAINSLQKYDKGKNNG